ncbi:MAG: DsbE family thiol:disulfide interchange protein [Paracoccaceae bacterium]|nr:DsbE family thiol:disulfide interchange protein [Paracoccaceae bacterium]
MPKISPLFLIPPLVFAGFVALVAVGMMREDPDAIPSTKEGQLPPRLHPTGELPGIPGFDNATLETGDVKIVNFWATWCAPCRVEHPNLVKLSEEGISIFGINYKDDPEKALAFLDELGDPFEAIISDENGRNGIEWGVIAMPESYVLDGEGRIVLHFRGPITQRFLESTIYPAIEEARRR